VIAGRDLSIRSNTVGPSLHAQPAPWLIAVSFMCSLPPFTVKIPALMTKDIICVIDFQIVNSYAKKEDP